MVSFVFSNHVYALAGGHGGGKSFHPFTYRGVYHSSQIYSGENLILLGLLLLFTGSLIRLCIRNWYVKSDKLSDTVLSAKIKSLFSSIQEAWADENIIQVKQLYTKRLFEKHSIKLREMQLTGQKNYVTITKIDGISRYKNPKEKIIVDISFKAIDYVKTTRDDQLISGSELEQKFKQRLTFVKNNDGLKLDKIRDLRKYSNSNSLQKYY